MDREINNMMFLECLYRKKNLALQITPNARAILPFI